MADVIVNKTCIGGTIYQTVRNIDCTTIPPTIGDEVESDTGISCGCSGSGSSGSSGDSGSGSGSGSSSGGGGTVIVDGCSDPVPTTLYATYSGNLAGIGVIEFVYDSISGEWVPQTTTSYEPCTGITLTISNLIYAGDSCNWIHSVTATSDNWSFFATMTFSPLTLDMLGSTTGTCAEIGSASVIFTE